MSLLQAPPGRRLKGCVPPTRLAEKKASIGYTYEDSTVAELENPPEKRADEDDSEEDSNTDEDEVIPDIGTSPEAPPVPNQQQRPPLLLPGKRFF